MTQESADKTAASPLETGQNASASDGSGASSANAQAVPMPANSAPATTVTTVTSTAVTPSFAPNVTPAAMPGPAATPGPAVAPGSVAFSHTLNTTTAPSGAATVSGARDIAGQNVLSQEDPWKSHQVPWASTASGRLAIRTFSRGVLGCAFFVWGGLKSGRDLKGYNPANKPENTLQFIAKLIDTCAGQPIKWTMDKLGHDGTRAVTFRPTRNFERYVKGGETVMHAGRSLGAEAVAITFDFAMASVGDAWGRNIAGIFDPAVKKSWMRDGHIDIPDLVRATLRSTWKIMTYNQLEDWAVAIPYAYYVRLQRHALDKAFPGFRFDSDKQANGGSFKINDKLEITGSYAAAGALDFQGRFMAYNVGTLMFREAYHKLADTWYSLIHPPAPGAAPEPRTGFSPFKALYNSVRYLVRTTVKGCIYMAPSVVFFWPARVSQNKYRGLAIHPEKGALAYTNGAGNPKFVAANDLHWGDSKLSRDVKNTYFMQSQEQARTGITNKHGVIDSAAHPFADTTDAHGNNVHFNPFSKTYGVVDTVLNPIGWFSNAMGNALKPLFVRVGHTGLGLDKAAMAKSPRYYANAVTAYLPYMYAKGEFANLWENKQMNVSIDRVFDGVCHLSLGEVKAGFDEMALTIMRKPLSDPDRQAEVERQREQERSHGRFDNSPSAKELVSMPYHYTNNLIRQRRGNWRYGEKPTYSTAANAAAPPTSRPKEFNGYVDMILGKNDENQSYDPNYGARLH